MATANQLYNRIATLLLCYIQYPYLERGEGLVNLGWIIRTSFIKLPEDFNTYEYPLTVAYTKNKIVNDLLHVLSLYFEGKDEGEFTFRAVHKFNGMNQNIDIAILY